MIIDCHVHLLPKKVRRDRTQFCETDCGFGSVYDSDKARFVSESEIIDYLDESEIDRAIVFGFPWEDPDLIRENNDQVWDFHDRYPDRIVPFAVLSPKPDESRHIEAERALCHGFAGIGELAVYHDGWSLSDFQALQPTLDLATKAQAPVLIHVNEPVGHVYPGKTSIDFRGLLQIISENPDMDFILAHWGGGVFFYALMPEVRKILTRTYVDTAASPFLYSADIFHIARSIIGPDKVLFGSDFPLLPLKRYIKELDKVGVEGEYREAILGENTRSILERRRPL